jgi:hypothetical protein
MAQQEIRELEQKLDDAFEEVMDGIKDKIRPLIAEGKFVDAIRVVQGYSGVYAAETEPRRRRIIDGLRHKQERWVAERQRNAQMLRQERMRYINSLVMAILADDLVLANEKITEMIQARAFRSFSDKLEEVRGVLQKAAAIDETIVNSFREQYGETIDVYLKSGMRTLTIRDVVGDRVKCRQQLSVGHGAVSIITIGVDDLSDYERLRRMGDDSQYDVALVKGIMAFQSSAYVHAEKYFSKTHPLLAKYLLAKIKGESGAADAFIPAEPDTMVPVTGASEETGLQPHGDVIKRKRHLRSSRGNVHHLKAERRAERGFFDE